MGRSLTALARLVRDVPNFPKKGIVFKDITPLLGHGPSFRRSVLRLARVARAARANKIVAIESRGFLFGSAVAAVLGVGVVPVRKKGKLPYKTLSECYALEYGKDTLEMHVDALRPGDRVLIVDDVLATGGTSAAVARLVKAARARVVGAVFLIELGFLKGRGKIPHFPVTALLTY